jgi:cholesterol transport system auxiliary component
MKPAHIAFALAFGLAACGPLVQIGGNAKKPTSLLTLSSTATPRAYAGPSKLADTIGVDVPGVPAALQTLRLPVTTAASQVTYLVGANWAEQPNKQFQRMLVDTIAAAGVPVIDLRQSNVPPARTLSGVLRSFGLDLTDAANPVVRVRFDAQISARPGGDTVSLRRFEATEPAFDQQPVAVANALNRAANRVATEAAAWVAG